MQNNSYKQIYLIDMDEVSKRPFDRVPSGILLPIVHNNGQPKIFSEHFAIKTVKSYPSLSKIIGEQDARTIIDYLDTDGNPIVTLYPTNDVDLHRNDWTKFSTDGFNDLQRTIQARQSLIAKSNSK